MDASKATHDLRATVTVHRDGVIRQWGEAATEVMGYSAGDTLGTSLDAVVPPVLRPLHWWGFDKAMKSGRLNNPLFKAPALCNDGHIVVAHATVESVPGTSGGSAGAVVTFVGVGPAWQGKAWQAALAPINLARRIWQRARPNR